MELWGLYMGILGNMTGIIICGVSNFGCVYGTMSCKLVIRVFSLGFSSILVDGDNKIKIKIKKELIYGIFEELLQCQLVLVQ